MPECTTHHYACDCREAMLKELVKLYSDIVDDDGWLEYNVSLEQIQAIYKIREALGLTYE